jgi:phospholipase C
VDYFANIKHLVVVMFENRSFDNLLGYLYSQGAAPANWPADRPVPCGVPPGQKFEGLWQFPGTTTTCEGAGGCNADGATKVAAYPHPLGVWEDPSPDPYEPWEHVRLQVFDKTGAITPTDTPTMGGFLRSYTDRLAADKNTTVPPSTIMGSYAPDQLPVLSTLAQNFAVFDHWFCAVPSQTYCNRAFFHASTSYGYVTNQPWQKWGEAPLAQNPTIFDVLESNWTTANPQPATAPWAVYFTGDVDPTLYVGSDGESGVTDYVGLTGLIHYEVGRKYGPPTYPLKLTHNNGRRARLPYPQRFWSFDKFFSDVAAGTLPQYTFIETLGGELPFPLPVPGKGYDFHPPGDVRNAEEVVRQIYEAIRTSGSAGNHDYTQDTMLLIVFDEHGGTYDHVAPPTTTPPDASPLEAPDCTFDRLGVRVPAIAISSWTLPGTIVNTEMHHAAVIKTLFRMNPGSSITHLSARDQPGTVATLATACNGPRAAAQPWPTIAAGTSPAACIVPTTGS